MAGNYDIAASIKLGGESEFRQAVNRASTELRSMDSALRHTTEQFALNDPSRMVYCSPPTLVIFVFAFIGAYRNEIISIL